jgi:hypothetical protein
VILVKERCMEPPDLPEFQEIKDLDGSRDNGTVTITDTDSAHLWWVITRMRQYIEDQYAECGKHADEKEP